jgi:hypothetical protein
MRAGAAQRVPCQARQVRLSRAAIAVALGVFLPGCEKDEAVLVDPVAEVSRAARTTLSEPSTFMDVRVTSPKAEYSVRGRIALRSDRYVSVARFARGGEQAFPEPPIHIVSIGREPYIADPGLPGLGGRRCWFDPHLPIGSAPGTASVQESLALVGIVTRLLARAVERAAVAEDAALADDRSNRYEVWLDAAAARAPYSEGDELFEARPKALAREVDLPVTIETAAAHLSAISLTLPRFETSAYLRRYRGVGAVSIEVSLNPATQRLKLHPTNCLAME